ncbi:hypothetical protein Ciccas_006702 [Cichlidogyrus casuarinus]|uniref:Poly(A) polymerase n=1 Tax=Cichlidogyrus casuarinus TaxID=1844966 RepID=A0ABD2Q512_9PLAT
MTDNSEPNIPSECLGETGALSLKQPNEQDLKETKELEAALTQMNIFETTEEILHRRTALVKLQDLANGWIRQKASEQNLPAHICEATDGKIFTFGSYRLGVNFQGADIDSLFVVPRFISREEFFKEFYEILKEQPDIEDLIAVVNAFVPVLKMKFMKVEIDLLFSKIDANTVPDNFSLTENTESLMRLMDEKDVRSINGVRVTEDILKLVYQKETFKTALKVIRYWAKRRNIYANALGFLGGVSWAILVCRICQLYPLASASVIVYMFFKVYSQWPWPKPVRLRETEFIPALCLPVWDPRHNPTDQYHLMPILTPSYPSQNSTYNVQRSNRIIIERELNEGLQMCRDIVMRKKDWKALFEPSFFFTYRHYVVIVVKGDQKTSFAELCGLVESKLRVLVANFETNPYVKMAHVNCRSFGRVEQDEAEFSKKWFIGMDFDKNANTATSLRLNKLNNDAASGEKTKVNVDLTENITSFERSIERSMDKPTENPPTFHVIYVKKSQLSQFIPTEDMEAIKEEAKNHAIQQAAKQADTPTQTTPRIASPRTPLTGEENGATKRKVPPESPTLVSKSSKLTANEALEPQQQPVAQD